MSDIFFIKNKEVYRSILAVLTAEYRLKYFLLLLPDIICVFVHLFCVLGHKYIVSILSSSGPRVES